MAKIRSYSGLIGSGKAYVMFKNIEKLKENGFSIAIISLADPIKKFCYDCLGIQKSGQVLHFNRPKTLDQLLEAFGNYFSVSTTQIKKPLEPYQNQINFILQNKISSAEARILMQFIGTELAQKIDKLFWVNLTKEQIKKSLHFDYIFIDDVRFMFELDSFEEYDDYYPYYVTAYEDVRAKRRGVSVELLREQCQHASERESIEKIFPYVVYHYPNNILKNN